MESGLSTSLPDELRSSTNYGPAWSPDGRTISFDARIAGRWTILTIARDGSNLRRLTHGPEGDFGSSWFPDGRRIAFVSTRDGNREIYVMRSDGSDARRLTDDPGEDTGPRVSPDGARIAFRSDRAGRKHVYVMRPDGTGLKRLSSDTLDVDGRLTWSGDGTAVLAYAVPHGRRSDLSTPARLYRLPLDGTPAPMTATPAREYNPSAFPDGRVAFDAHRDGAWESDDGKWEIFVVGADGAERRPLTSNDVNDWGPAVSGDGASIAYCSGLDDTYEIHVMSSDGSQPRRLTRNVPMWMRRHARDEEAAGRVVDSRDRQAYRTVRIGGRVWLAENLRFHTPASRCLTEEEQSCARSGRLYRWLEALAACPSGFRLPSETDWRDLERHLGIADSTIGTTGHRGSDEGERLRVGGDTGFDAHLTGYRRPDGTPRRGGERAAFWTATVDETAPESSPRAWHRDLSQDPRIYRSPVEITYWLSVRCVAELPHQQDSSLSPG